VDVLGSASLIDSVLDSILTVCALTLAVGSAVAARRALAALSLPFASRRAASRATAPRVLGQE
jgi:hypothetical protein